MASIYIAADHRGVELKDGLQPWLREHGYEPIDLTPPMGPDGMIDYPLVSHVVAKRVAQEHGLGLLICGSGNGIAIAANRFKGVRASNAHNPEEIALAKAHNHINVLCLGADALNLEEAARIVERWLTTPEDRAERRLRRLAQMDEYGS